MRNKLRLPPERDLPPGRVTQRKQHLMQEVARTLEAERVRGGRGRRSWLVAASVAAAALAVALVVPVLRTGTGGARAEAAEVLRRAARAAEEQGPVVSLDGYRYTKSEGAHLATIGDDIGVSALVPVVRELWVAPDGSGRILQREGEQIFLGPGDREKWEEAGKPPLAGAGTIDERVGPGELHYEDFEGLPTDPDDLFEEIMAKAEPPDVPPEVDETEEFEQVDVPARMLVIVGDLLRETVAPPDLRAALYEVAARIPGIELVGEVTDPAGRRGMAVAVESDYSGALIREELIFDPDTSEMLAERRVLLERVNWLDADPPEVIGHSVYLKSGVVDSTDDRP